MLLNLCSLCLILIATISAVGLVFCNLHAILNRLGILLPVGAACLLAISLFLSAPRRTVSRLWGQLVDI